MPARPIDRPLGLTSLRRLASGGFGRALFMALVLLVSSTGCQKVTGALARAPIPNLGPPIPVSAKIEFDPSLSKAMLQYTNACNSPQQLRVGEELESILLQAAHQTFKKIYFGGKMPAGAQPDVEVTFALRQSGLEIQTDGIYDRLPAELTLEVVALFRDRTGKVLLEQSIDISRKEKLILEPTQHRCAYVTTDVMLHDASITLAVQFIRHARALLDPDSQLAMTGESPDQPPSQAADATPKPAPKPIAPTAPAANSPLAFKATVLDENGNHILEGGERVRVRVEIVNTGPAVAKNVAVTLGGTMAVVSQFPAASLPAGSIQPGESRSLEFVTTLPQAMRTPQGSLTVSVAEASGLALPAAQTLPLGLPPRDSRSAAQAPIEQPYQFDRVDQVPAAAKGFAHPQTHLVAIGINAYRDPQIPTRKYAAQDAELVAAYFQSLGGVPATNIRLLQDHKALKPDIEEALLDWLPTRTTANSTVILYFSGQAFVSPSGETFLAPYEGNSLSTSRLYSLRELQSALAKLKARHTVLIFDGAVGRLGKGKKSDPVTPSWDTGSGNLVKIIGTTGLRSGLEPSQVRHGLFTYYLLSGLKGEADADQNGEVTLGELTTFLSQTVPVAAKTHFGQDQRPLVSPPLTPVSSMASLPLTKSATSR